MVGYLAMRIEAGKLDYKTVFSNQTYKPFKEEVDVILISDGYQDKIKAIE